MVKESIKRLNHRVAKSITTAINWLYIPPINRFITPQILRYGVCGVVNYIVIDALLYFIIYHYIIGERMVVIASQAISPHIASLVIVFPITFLTGFWLNRYVAFNATAPSPRVQIVKYAATICGSILLSYIIVKVAVEILGVWPTPSKVLSSLLTSIYSYLMARYFTFRG